MLHQSMIKKKKPHHWWHGESQLSTPRAAELGAAALFEPTLPRSEETEQLRVLAIHQDAPRTAEVVRLGRCQGNTAQTPPT